MVDFDSRARPGGPAAPAGPPVVPQEFSRVALVAVTVAVLPEVLRAAFPPFGHFAATSDAVARLRGDPSRLPRRLPRARAARRLPGRAGCCWPGSAACSPVRLGMQALSGDAQAALWLAFAGAAFGMLALTALYETARGLSGTGFAVAVVGGLTADTALRVGLRHLGSGRTPGRPALARLPARRRRRGGRARTAGAHPAVRGAGDSAGATHSAPRPWGRSWRCRSSCWPAPRSRHRADGCRLPVAGAVVLGAQALTLAFLSSGLAVAAVPGGVCVFGGALLGVGVGAVTGRYGLTGLVAVAVIVAGQTAVGLAARGRLPRAAAPRRLPRPARVRTPPVRIRRTLAPLVPAPAPRAPARPPRVGVSHGRI